MDYFFTAVALLMFLGLQELDGRLIITLEEPDGTPADNVLVQVSHSRLATNNSRRINLVQGRTFHLHCEAEADGDRGNRHGNSLDVTWYQGDNEVPVGSASDPNRRPMVYTYLEGNRQTLVLTNFAGANVGVYKCRERGGTSMLEEAAIIVGEKNPTVITASEAIVLREGNQGNFRPVLRAFISGTPYPSASNITWQFNNRPYLPNGILIENGHELLLPGNIGAEIAGVYTCHVTTSAGSVSANISVSLIYQPSVSLSPFGRHFVEVGSSVRLTCKDSRGVPPPIFMWTHNGSNLTTGSHTRIVESVSGSYHSSSLTIEQFQPSYSGLYMCTASNDAGSSYQTINLNLPQTSPPAPPTSIHVIPLSACSVRIEWVWPQIADNDDIAPPDYITFEVNFIGESNWMEIGTADITQTSHVVVGIPWKGVNANFRFRCKSVSTSRGAGNYSTPTDTFTAHSEATLSRFLSDLSTQVLSSSMIQVSWTLSEQDCFNFTAFTVSCKSATQVYTMRTSSDSIKLEGGSAMATIITGLSPDTSHNCSVTSELRGGVAGEVAERVTTYAAQLATTYPKFGLFQLLLTGISNCEEWIKESAAAKKEGIAVAVAQGIEELCQCGFNTTNIQMGEMQCSLSSQTGIIIFRAEIHSTPQTDPLPQLLYLLQEWIGGEPQLLVHSQLLQVDESCSAVPASSYNEEACEKLSSETHWTKKITSTYGIVGIAVGSALILVLCVTMVIICTTILMTRHRKTAKLNSSSSETKQDIVPSASNPEAVTDIESPYYEEMDLHHVHEEPQYETLDEYDRLPSSTCADKIPQPKHADCPVYEPTINDNWK